MKKNIELHPREITHVQTREQIEGFLHATGFSLIDFAFGPRDFFTYQVIVAQKNAQQAPRAAAQAAYA